MNVSALGKIASGLLAQNVTRNYDVLSTRDTANPRGKTETSSFQSMLQLIDTNGDGTLDANEMQVGLEGFISAFFLARDLDGDPGLNAEEAGISTEAASGLDANGNRKVDGEEVLDQAGRLLEGLIALLDANNDQSLSTRELAIIELLFGSVAPAADSESIFERSRSAEGETLSLNMETIPERMRAAGFEGSDNALYYALAHVYNLGPGREMPTEGDESLMALNRRRDEIHQWFEGEMTKVENILRTNPRATLTAITNDARDRCGFRLGPAMVERLQAFGDRVQLGDVVPVSAY
jgi:Ca2+-binding EF-hand superfamily protein